MPLAEPYLKISLIRLFILTPESTLIKCKSYVLSSAVEADREPGNYSFYSNSSSFFDFYDLTIYALTSKQGSNTAG